MIIGRSVKPGCLHDQRRCTRSSRYGLRQRCFDFVANRRGHIVERRTEKRGFSETRHAILRGRTDHLSSPRAGEGLSLTPKAGSDIERSRQTVIPNGILEIKAYACRDSPAALLDTKIWLRHHWLGAPRRHPTTDIILPQGALEADPEPGDAANEP